MQLVSFKVPTRIVDKLPSVRVYMFGSATFRGGGTPRSPNHFHGWTEGLTVISAIYKKAQSTRMYSKRLVKSSLHANPYYVYSWSVLGYPVLFGIQDFVFDMVEARPNQVSESVNDIFEVLAFVSCHHARDIL